MKRGEKTCVRGERWRYIVDEREGEKYILNREGELKDRNRKREGKRKI